MARKPRIYIPGGIYHVMLRGNGGQDIFFLDEDRYGWYLLMQEGVERYGHRIHGFCLMTNHVHLAFQVDQTPLPKIMQNRSLGLGDGHREDFHGGGGDGRVLGDDRFIERVLAKGHALSRPNLTLTEVARRYRRDVATLSEAVRRVQRQVSSSGVFRGRYEKLVDSIAK